MSGAITKFAVTSMVMWMAPVVIMYGFYYQVFPGVSQMSSSAQTLASWFLAVIAVNLVIGYYIFMAMKETPHQEPQPDPTFMAKAKASINQPTTSSQNAVQVHFADVEKEAEAQNVLNGVESQGFESEIMPNTAAGKFPVLDAVKGPFPTLRYVIVGPSTASDPLVTVVLSIIRKIGGADALKKNWA